MSVCDPIKATNGTAIKLSYATSVFSWIRRPFTTPDPSHSFCACVCQLIQLIYVLLRCHIATQDSSRRAHSRAALAPSVSIVACSFLRHLAERPGSRLTWSSNLPLARRKCVGRTLTYVASRPIHLPGVKSVGMPENFAPSCIFDGSARSCERSATVRT